MPRLILIACFVLAGCGADGLPEPPSRTGLAPDSAPGIGAVMR